MPKGHYLPLGDRYRPMYRWFQESPWTLVPDGGSYSTSGQAVAAADAYMAKRLNPPIRSEQAEVIADVLDVNAWYRERAGQAARDQQEALGAIIVKGRQVAVEKRARGRVSHA